jgi:hypothetical protein
VRPGGPPICHLLRHEPSFSAEATSTLTAQMLADIQAAWTYQRDLHIVVEATDQTLAASCIAWLDPTTHSATIEPLGVPRVPPAGTGWRPLHAYGATLHAAGGREIVVHPRGDAGYPAPLGVYLRCEFHNVGRTRLYARY